MALYQLVFKGECTEGTAPGDAREAARSLFKASVDQLEKMFSGRPVVIRNKLDKPQAEKYRAVLAKHGMLSYVELMPGETAEAPAAATDSAPPHEKKPNPFLQPETAAPEPSSQPQASPASSGASNKSVAVEPGERLNVAGERVDAILASSQLSLDPVGVRIEAEKSVEAPMFQNMDDWSLAPPGTDLGEKRETAPVVTPDISHLNLADD